MKLFKKYFADFALIFVSVLLAFMLTEWSSGKGERISETKILTEIKNGINSDLSDFKSNLMMHKFGQTGVTELRNWANNNSYNRDSIPLFYFVLFRNYSPIINKTGYESLKSTNLKTISNDSLRFQIIKLYDFHYNILEQIENENDEMEDFKTYFQPVNSILSPYMVFEESGKLKTLQEAVLSKNQKNELLSYLWRMELTKKFKIMRYTQVIEEIRKLNASIEQELLRKQ